MSIIEAFQHLGKQKKIEQADVFVALTIEDTYLQGVSFTLTDEGGPHITGIATELHDVIPSWEERIISADKILSKLNIGEEGVLNNLLFGFGEAFVSDEGDIEKEVKPHLRDLTTKLALKPIGFVPVVTALTHFLKKTEGVPASAIIVLVQKNTFDVVISRVGRIAGKARIDRSGEPGKDIETVLRKESGDEVLPSRIILVGVDTPLLSEVKSLLLTYQWAGTSNFLHYPRVDIFEQDNIGKAVSFAGAAELTKTVEFPVQTPVTSEQEQKIEEPTPVAVVQKEEVVDNDLESEEDLIEEQQEEEGRTSHMVIVQPENLGFQKSTYDIHAPEKVENFISDNLKTQHGSTEEERAFMRPKGSGIFDKVRGLVPPLSGVFSKFRNPRFAKIGIGIALIAIVLIGGFIIFSQNGRAAVTISILPVALAANTPVTIDPNAQVLDESKKIIQGKKVETSVTGEKTVPTTGKKKIGDPAKGTITIFNKSETNSYSLKKGTVVSSGTIQFTLDADVSIASATSSIGSSTYGKSDVSVTASAVGEEGNIGSGKEFNMKDYPTSVMVGRNDQPFTGGVSRQVTVVSRADTDGLVKALSDELVEQSKAELAGKVSGRERLIDATIKTVVTEKTFVEELDQEAKELHGKVTVTISAISYDEDQIQKILSGMITDDIPEGYRVEEAKTVTTIGKVTVAKDGKISASADIAASSVPAIEESDIKKNISGKTIEEAQSFLRSIRGVAGVEFGFEKSVQKNRLPKNVENIQVIIVTQ